MSTEMPSSNTWQSRRRGIWLPAIRSSRWKKKELVGTYRNAGREWHPEGDPEQVKVHDFVDPAIGKANPYGVYDVANNLGWVLVGTDHDTAAFAVATIRRWWEHVGRPLHPAATRLLICADVAVPTATAPGCGKPHWANLATQTGLIITVAHLPPGTWKWNQIEHRLFSHISMNWRGRPLTSHEVIVQTISSTTMTTGLTVQAELDDTLYPKDIKIADVDMQTLEATGILTPDPFTVNGTTP